MKTELLTNYAKLAIKVGVNLQKGQMLIINAPIEAVELVRLLVKVAYQEGAKDVMVRWNDQIIGKEWYLNAQEDVLNNVQQWVVEQFKYIVNENAAVISLSSPNPGLFSDVPGERLQMASIASSKALNFYRKHTSSNHTQWLVLAVPNLDWAQKVFPNEESGIALEKLWGAIFQASRVSPGGDAIKEWHNHMQVMERHNRTLNEHNFQSLHFKNKIGTDIVVELVENHIWAGGGEYSTKGVFFAPNIPTEEAFTMPHRLGVNGRVVSTKPLNYQGKLIEDFYLIFKDGKVVDFDAKKEKETLANLLATDEGSKRLGEVALISHDSPISNMNILFYNTLFDENASCHFALGSSYPTNMKGGVDLDEAGLKAKGGNVSLIHVDFMFGSADMTIIGKKALGEEIVIFKEGNFV